MMDQVNYIPNIVDVRTLHDFIDYLAHANEGLAALVLVVTGAMAWAIKSYVALVVWQYRRRIQIIEVGSILLLDIQYSVRSYSSNFGAKSKEETIATLNDMRASGQYRPYVLSESKDEIPIEVKNNITILPLAMSEAHAAFRITELEFDASYKSLGDPQLPSVGYDGILKIIEAAYEDVESCIGEGGNAIKVFNREINSIKEINSLIVGFHTAAGVLISITLMYALRAWPF